MLKNIHSIPAFEKDYRALKKKHHDMDKLWIAVDAIMSEDRARLDTQYRDHALKGNWLGYRELHIEGDWLLIYRIEENGISLVLTRTDTHDNLFSAKMSKKIIKQYGKSPRHSGKIGS